MNDTEILDAMTDKLLMILLALAEDKELQQRGEIDDSYIYDLYRYFGENGFEFPGLFILEALLERQQAKEIEFKYEPVDWYWHEKPGVVGQVHDRCTVHMGGCYRLYRRVYESDEM